MTGKQALGAGVVAVALGIAALLIHEITTPTGQGAGPVTVSSPKGGPSTGLPPQGSPPPRRVEPAPSPPAVPPRPADPGPDSASPAPFTNPGMRQVRDVRQRAGDRMTDAMRELVRARAVLKQKIDAQPQDPEAIAAAKREVEERSRDAETARRALQSIRMGQVPQDARELPLRRKVE